MTQRSRSNDLRPLFGSLHQTWKWPYHFVLVIEKWLLEYPFIFYFILLELVPQLIDLYILVFDLLIELLLFCYKSTKNHLLLSELVVDFSHGADLVLCYFELFEYFFDVFLLNCVLISQFLNDDLELSIFFMVLLVLFFELLDIVAHSLQLS